jgi:hypothetical protein
VCDHREQLQQLRSFRSGRVDRCETVLGSYILTSCTCNYTIGLTGSFGLKSTSSTDTNIAQATTRVAATVIYFAARDRERLLLLKLHTVSICKEHSRTDIAAVAGVL